MTESKSPGALAALGASEIDQLGGQVGQENSLRIPTAQPLHLRAGKAPTSADSTRGHPIDVGDHIVTAPASIRTALIDSNAASAALAARPRRAHIFEHDAFGHYVEPLWCSARLFDAESFGSPSARVLDPACGWGRILKAAQDAGYTPIGSDIIDRRTDPHAFAHAGLVSATF